MSSWSTLRRTSSSFHLRQLRQFSAHAPPPETTTFFNSSTTNNNVRTKFLRWISAGIITSSTLALALYSCSSSPSTSSSLAFANCSTIPLTTTTGPAVSSQDTKHQSKFLFGDAYRRKIFFNYEKRIRMRSPPEKVFEYFASIGATGEETFMTPADLMRALVPVFPPSESNLVRDGYLRGERNRGELRCAPSQFFLLFDTNSDGLISFKEEIDREEFKKVMTLMRAHNRQGAVHSDGLRAGHKLGASAENGGLVEYFFGKDGKLRLHHDKFVQFLRDLRDEMLRLEFAHYDYKLRGTISAKDFALSMVASADIKHLNKLLDRVDDLDNEPHLRNMRVTFEEFKSFAELRRKLQPFSLALFSFGQVNGLLTRKDLQRAASQINCISIWNYMLNCDH